MNSLTKQKPFVLLDEFGYYCGHNNDHLIEELRKIEGVPNAAYLVRDGQVFVFDKLVQMVKAKRDEGPAQSLDDLARSLIAEATVCAQVAVKTWGVVPEPYEVVESPSGYFVRHRSFNARLPGTFSSRDDVEKALAVLLLGHIQPGVGHFTYRAQPMTLCDSLDTASLPPRPAIECVGEATSYHYKTLGHVTYESGFEPVSESLFNEVRGLEAAWKEDVARAGSYLRDRAFDIWKLAPELRLETLNDLNFEVPDYGREDFAELRTLYPELSMLSDGALYAWFDVYQMECCYLNSWIASRDVGFLFYLIGKVAARRHEEHTAKEVGQWAAFALLRGDSLDAALAFGQSSVLYDRAMSRFARRISHAMSFLAHDKNATDLRGRPVTTVMDGFRAFRKPLTEPSAAQQSGTDFVSMGA